MPLRLIEAILPENAPGELPEVLGEQHVAGIWPEQLHDGQVLVRVLVSAQQAEQVLDRLEARYSGSDRFRLMLLPVEATLPRLEPPEENGGPGKTEASEEANNAGERVSREELYTDIAEGARLSVVYLVTVVLSTVVAAVGLMRGDVAIIVGAMVIAPLLRPNVALALASTLGDLQLAARALRANLAGLGLALGLSIAIGSLFQVDLSVAAIASRTSIGAADVVIALAAGSAGALAFTTGAPVALIGVMVAVALLPPLVALGLVLASGEFSEALGATLLVLTNVICVNLAGVVTFLVQGIQPRSWWEKERATRATRIAVTLWALLLGILIAGIVLSTK